MGVPCIYVCTLFSLTRKWFFSARFVEVQEQVTKNLFALKRHNSNNSMKTDDTNFSSDHYIIILNFVRGLVDWKLVRKLIKGLIRIQGVVNNLDPF